MIFVPPILGDVSLLTLIIVNLIVAAVGIAVQLLLAKKPEGLEAAGASEFELPTSMVGRAVPHVRGKRIVKGINVLSPAFHFSSRDRKKSDQTVAVYYYFSVWVGICLQADGVKLLRAGGITLWPTLKDDDVEAADGLTFASLQGEEVVNVFGGYTREGGQQGKVVFLDGDDAQTLPEHITNEYGTNIPAARGMFTALFEKVDDTSHKDYGRGYYWGNSTYPKWPEFLIKATDYNVDGSAIWLSSKSNVGSDDDFNPVHAIREWITDARVGRGQSTALIGSSFQTVATTVHSEGYGISYVLNSVPDELQDYIDDACAIIDGVLVFDPSTGTYEINLARDDYNVDTLDFYDESDFWVRSFERPSMGKVPSKVNVKFKERLTGDWGVGSEDDIALIEMQGSHPLIRDLDYSAFVCSQTVADKIAAREQKQLSALGAQIEIECLRTMAQILPGDVFKISIASMGITNMVVRAIQVKNGDLENDSIIMNIAEDVFGIIYTTFGDPGSPASNPPVTWVETDNIAKFTTLAGTENGPY